MPTVNFNGETLTVELARYRNGCTALALHDEAGEPYAMASVALPTQHPDGCVWVKDYSENAGMKKDLLLADSVGCFEAGTGR